MPHINQHAMQDASRLGGSYGIKEGVNILPESRAGVTEVKVLSSSRDELGADTKF